jgi:octanoyl-[GcvH]:protein N-octanoyltransferase
VRVEVRLDGDARLAEELARDEAVAALYGEPVARLWVVRRGLALGQRDARLPGWEAAARRLRADGVDVALRTSGGQAVGLTDGVLNIALAWPGPDAPSLERAFQALTDLLAAELERLGLPPQVGEVAGGFCPGRTDLAVGGRKVAGLSQRRRREAVMVHAFLWVRDPSPVDIVAAFYRLAGDGPPLRPDAMASLSELAGRALGPAEVAASLLPTLERL